MDIFLTYSKYSLSSLSAVAGACSKSVRLIESNEINNLSMSPTFEALRSSNAINCFILNFDPLDLEISNDLLWEAKFIKPKIYNFYKSSNCSGGKIKSDVQNLIEAINIRFSNKLSVDKLRPLELAIWSDLYFLLANNSPFKFNIPSQLNCWFQEFNKIKYMKTAVSLVLGNSDIASMKETSMKLPELPIHELELSPEIIKAPLMEKEEERSLSKSELEMYSSNWLNAKIYDSAPIFPKPPMPMPNTNNIMITSALPYVNNVPHLGNLIGSTLSGDFYSRYCRLRGRNVIYVCGTDEYGTATEVKAATEGCSPREICDRYNAIHKSVYDWFQIDFDVFGRTSDDHHKEVVTEIFHNVRNNGFINEDNVEQLWCGQCKMFLADRFVEGTCRFCNYEDARGDQCDKCGHLIQANQDLIRPRCKMCNNCPTVQISKHLFLNLTDLQEKLEEIVKLKESNWSVCARGITHSWLNEGLKPRCITRDLKWGVPVPLEGFETKVFYVWFDAVLGYLSILRSLTPHWRNWWWPTDTEVKLVQFMAKDNVPFHSVLLPAILAASAASPAHTMVPVTPKCIAATEYLNYEGQKFSKSRNFGVFGTDAETCDLPADLWRFYLASVRPESQDSSFSWIDFVTRCNSELLNNLGNFVNRALSFLVRFFDSTIQPSMIEDYTEDVILLAKVTEEFHKYCHSMDEMGTSTRDALSAVLSISRLGNGYIQSTKPWVLVRKPETSGRAGAIVSLACNISLLIGNMLQPFMPNYSTKILDQCNASENLRWIPEDIEYFTEFLTPGHVIGDVTPLFVKIESEFVEKMKEKFGSVAQ